MGNNRGRWVSLLGVLTTALSLSSTQQGPVRLCRTTSRWPWAIWSGQAQPIGGLGFALKPGRHHANGIRNAHVKFPNGAGIELLTAPKAVDALSAHYVDLLRAGDGPAFVSFHARDTERLHGALREGGYDFRQDGETTKLQLPEFAYLFLVRNNQSPTDLSTSRTQTARQR